MQGESREKKVENQQQQNNTIEDLMDDSDDPFGVEYFTRSDDEGFGVIYISHWKLSDSEDEENNGGHEKHTEEYDKLHGGHVKDEEVGHQHEKKMKISS